MSEVDKEIKEWMESYIDTIRGRVAHLRAAAYKHLEVADKIEAEAVELEKYILRKIGLLEETND